jgi:Tol biopolymer transport system component
MIAAADGQGARVIVADKVSLAPAVSPDGKSVAFFSNREGSLRVWTVDVDGGSPRAVSPGPRDANPVFGADGKTIFYTALGQEPQRIFKVPAAGGAPSPVGPEVPVTKGEEPFPRNIADISPDGRLLVGSVEVPALHAFRAMTVALDGKGPSKRFDFVPNDVHFTPDGRGLSYIDTKAGVSNIWVQPIDGGAPRQVTAFTSDRIYSHAWSHDGRMLVVCRGDSTNDVVLISNLGR